MMFSTHCAFSAASILALVLLLSGCGPSLSPLYRDYEVDPHQGTIEERVETALRIAGWPLAEASADNVIATQERKVKDWGLYKVIVSLEAIPVSGDHVRLYFHPYRHYFTGSRSKLPYLNKGLQRALLSELHEAFEEQGLHAIGTAIERDRAVTSR